MLEYSNVLPSVLEHRYSVSNLSDISSISYGICADTVWIGVNNKYHTMHDRFEQAQPEDYLRDVQQMPNLEAVYIMFTESADQSRVPVDMFRGTRVTSVILKESTHLDIAELLSPISASLTRLELESVHFDRLPPAPKLEYLSISRCKCSNSLTINCPLLKDLYIFDSHISCLPDVRGCTELRKFCIEDCDLSEDDCSSYDWSALTNLTELVVTDCQLGPTLDDSFGSLTNLRSLSFTGCRLEGSIPASIGRLSSLENLNLSSNKLSDGLSTLAGLDSLVFANLSDNDFHELPVELCKERAQSIHIDLRDTYVESIPDLPGIYKDCHVTISPEIKPKPKYWSAMVTDSLGVTYSDC